MTLKQALMLTICVTVGIFVGVAALTLLGGQLGVGRLSIAQTTTSKDRLFDVSGTAEISTIPDKAELSVGVTASDTTVKLVQDKVNAITEKMVADLKSLGFEEKDIKTEQYSVYPNYSRDGLGGVQRITGYSVSTSIRIRTSNFDRMNDAVDVATKAGANTIGQISFIVSDQKQKEIAKQGRKEAIENAKQKAQELSSFSGMKLGRILNITESDIPRPFYLPAMALQSSNAGETAKTSLEPGSTKLNYSIVLSYETL